jgi:hypothetical protein
MSVLALRAAVDIHARTEQLYMRRVDWLWFALSLVLTLLVLRW